MLISEWHLSNLAVARLVDAGAVCGRSECKGHCQSVGCALWLDTDWAAARRWARLLFALSNRTRTHSAVPPPALPLILPPPPPQEPAPTRLVAGRAARGGGHHGSRSRLRGAALRHRGGLVGDGVGGGGDGGGRGLEGGAVAVAAGGVGAAGAVVAPGVVAPALARAAKQGSREREGGQALGRRLGGARGERRRRRRRRRVSRPGSPAFSKRHIPFLSGTHQQAYWYLYDTYWQPGRPGCRCAHGKAGGGLVRGGGGGRAAAARPACWATCSAAQHTAQRTGAPASRGSRWGRSARHTGRSSTGMSQVGGGGRIVGPPLGTSRPAGSGRSKAAGGGQGCARICHQPCPCPACLVAVLGRARGAGGAGRVGAGAAGGAPCTGRRVGDGRAPGWG